MWKYTHKSYCLIIYHIQGAAPESERTHEMYAIDDYLLVFLLYRVVWQVNKTYGKICIHTAVTLRTNGGQNFVILFDGHERQERQQRRTTTTII